LNDKLYPDNDALPEPHPITNSEMYTIIKSRVLSRKYETTCRPYSLQANGKKKAAEQYSDRFDPTHGAHEDFSWVTATSAQFIPNELLNTTDRSQANTNNSVMKRKRKMEDVLKMLAVREKRDKEKGALGRQDSTEEKEAEETLDAQQEDEQIEEDGDYGVDYYDSDLDGVGDDDDDGAWME
jgi:hypothetical protein